MKITLIVLPLPFLHDPKRNVPLGILYIAAALEKEHHSVFVADLRDIKPEHWLVNIPYADIYGISATSIEYYTALDIANKLKKERGEITIVLGGVHATVTDEAEIDSIFNVVVKGQGETLIAQVVNDYINKNLKKVYKFEHSDSFNLDSILFPARHLLPYSSIVSTQLVNKGFPATTIMSSRGCYYNCVFCSNKSIYGQHVYYHSIDYTVNEIKHIKRLYDVNQFRFHDDSMTGHVARLREFREKIAPLNILFRCNGRVNEITPDKLTLLAESGCEEIGYGIETINQKSLNSCNKHISVEQCIKAIEMTHAAGMKVRLFFIVGLPDDFGDLSGNIINFLQWAKPDGVNISTLCVYPGTELWRNTERYDMNLYNKDLSKYRFTVGIEEDDDFCFDYGSLMSNETLKWHRLRLLRYVKENNLVLND